MTIYAYYRVSTEMQDYESQKVGVVEYCNRLGYKIDKEVVDDGVSGTVEAKKRNLWKIVKAAKKGDWLITSELSRLGRSTSDVLNTCNVLSKNGVNVWFVKQGMGLDQTPMGKMMVAILSAFAEMERDLIAQRTTEGLKRAKANGVVLGRKKGFTYRKLDKYRDEITVMVRNGASITQICKGLKVNWPTVQRYLKEKGLYEQIQKPKRSSPVEKYKEDVIKMANEGCYYKEIGEKIGFSAYTIRQFCTENNIKICKNKQQHILCIKGDELKKMILKGCSYKSIGAKFGIHPVTVSNYCKKNNIIRKKIKRIEPKKIKRIEPIKRIKLQPMETVWFGAKKG